MGCVSLPKSLFLQTPGIRVLNVRKKKQQACISVSKRPNCVTNSLSVDSIIPIKEETEFKSSFDEYLKALESIRADREKNKGQKESKGSKKKLNDVASTKKAPKIPRQEEPRMLKRSSDSNFDEKDGLYEWPGVEEKVVVKSRKESVYKRENSSKYSYAEKREVTNSNSVWTKNMLMVEMSSEDDEMDRFVFESPELNNRRVTQMEMELRIQKLAKCLHESDVRMPEWMFSKTMRSGGIRFSDHSIMRIIQILGKHGNWRMVLLVVEWLQMNDRFKSHKIRYVYTAALGVLGKARRPVEALNLFSAMKRYRNSYPDIVAYHSIAVTLGQAGHMKELFDVIDSMRSLPPNFMNDDFEDWDPRLEPHIVVYNAVLNACVTRKEWEGAFWVLEKLVEIDQPPSSTTYGLLMEVMLACGKYDLVHEFFTQMQATYPPNALTYRVLVNTLWREGKPDEAISAVEEMESRGLVGSASLYYDLARCLCSVGRCEEALMQVEKICKVASKPLVVTYTGIMQAGLESGNSENGIFIYKHMQKYCSPNLATCNILLKAYLRHGMFTETIELFQKMTENRLSGNRFNGYIKPDIHTFNLMLEACVKENRWDEFDYAYDRMLLHGIPFNTKRHLWMVLQASEAGKAEPVEMTWKHLMKSSRIPPPGLVKVRFRLKMKDNDLTAAIASVAAHPSTNQQSFSKEAWSKLFEENSHCFNKEALQQLIHEINVSMSNCESPNIIYQNLRDCCVEFVGLDEQPVTGRKHPTETPVLV